jgi:hypothetical protein
MWDAIRQATLPWVILASMAIDSILAQIDSEIARLTQARKLLAGAAGVANFANHKKSAGAPKKGKRTRVLSAEARKRIADAQRRRWAAQKSKSKKEG